jgi:signal recognition particle GTPase
MRNTLRTLAVIGGLFVATFPALADEQRPHQAEGQMPGMMQGENGMSGMMGMMQMMQQMGPMMEQCREMMAAMTDHMKSGPHATESDEG